MLSGCPGKRGGLGLGGAGPERRHVGRNRAVSGATLDLVVDFLAYVLVPVVALARSDLMPAAASLWLRLLVVVASALHFADKRMKTADHWFRSFPAVWNVFALYLFVLRRPGRSTRP